MLHKMCAIAMAGLVIALASGSHASILVEDFEAPFPAWESGWLGTNSNLQNYYGVGAGRGNNPDGLWLTDGGVSSETNIVFDPTFGASLSSLSLDIATFIGGLRVQIFDMANAVLFDQIVAPTFGAFTDPGVYVNVSANSASGISRFRFSASSAVEGNTSIDNVVVNAQGDPGVVPEASSGIIWCALICAMVGGYCSSRGCLRSARA